MTIDFAAIVTEGAATTAPIDWYTTMRDCVGDAAELADRISTSDSNVGGAIGRLCNAVTHLLDENKALTERVVELEKWQAYEETAELESLEND